MFRLTFDAPLDARCVAVQGAHWHQRQGQSEKCRYQPNPLGASPRLPSIVDRDERVPRRSYFRRGAPIGRSGRGKGYDCANGSDRPPVVTDGEQTKPSFATYPLTGLRNIAPDGVVIPFADGHTRQLPRLTGGPFEYAVHAVSYFMTARQYARDL